jgi:A/G-specific adenine glycosylase
MSDPRITKLLAWYKRHARNLPWRGTQDPYRILVSEVMLQQTQVSRVLAYYPRWLQRFPSWDALARASTTALLHAWAGLGYNRRALQLRKAAQQVSALKRTPRTIEEWKRLPGIGPYTAAAVYGFSQHKRVMAIDTNVRRVAGRIFFGLLYPLLTDDARIAARLEKIVPRSNAVWMLPQAFMDLGSAHCTARNPQCNACPLRNTCKAAPTFVSGHAPTKKHAASREHIQEGKRYPDRIYRGRLVNYLRIHGATRVHAIGAKIDETFDVIRDHDWLLQITQRLVRDGLIEIHRDIARLSRT